MESCFTPGEWRLINGRTSEHGQLCQFYTHWTLKESFVKAIGTGLGFDLQRAEFYYSTMTNTDKSIAPSSSSSSSTTTTTTTTMEHKQSGNGNGIGPPPSSIDGLFAPLSLRILPPIIPSRDPYATTIVDNFQPTFVEPSVWPHYTFTCATLDDTHIAATCVQGNIRAYHNYH
jgi:hypothetical protein